MRRSNLQRGAADTLAALLATAVPSLAGKIHSIPEDWNTVATYPALAIVPRRATLTPWPDQEIDDTVDGQLLVECGTIEATFELRLLAPQAAVREDIEPQIIEAFFRDPDRPGVLLGQVASVALALPTGSVVGTTYNAPVAYALDSDEWRDELVFSAKRQSHLSIAVQWPLLVLRSPVYAMNDIYVAVTHDLSSATPSVDEQVLVNSDGTVTRA